MTEREIQKELSKLDHRLFLDKRADEYGRIYYCVCFNHGQGEPFETVRWVYPDGSPKPYLNDDLINAVRYQEGSIEDAIKRAKKNNETLAEKRKQEFQQFVEDLADDWRGRKGRLIFHTTGAKHNTGLGGR